MKLFEGVDKEDELGIKKKEKTPMKLRDAIIYET